MTQRLLNLEFEILDYFSSLQLINYLILISSIRKVSNDFV